MFKKILKTIGQIGDTATDVGADLNIPIVSQIDAVKDKIKSVVTKDKEVVQEVVTDLETIRGDIVNWKGGKLSRTRLKLAILNAIAVALIYGGLDPAVADQVAMYVTVPIVGYLLGETVRPSGTK